MESGKVFEAHEQVAQLRQVSAIRESQVRELQNVVASERQTISKLQDANTALNREVKELRVSRINHTAVVLLLTADCFAWTAHSDIACIRLNFCLCEPCKWGMP